MAGKIQRNNKTNKVSKKGKHTRRTRRVTHKPLHKRKQRKGGDIMSTFNDLTEGKSRGIMARLRKCNMNEERVTDENNITEGEFKSNDGENIKVTRICRPVNNDSDNNNVTFVTNNKENRRISMKEFEKKYPTYQAPPDGDINEDPIKYYFEYNYTDNKLRLKKKLTQEIKSRFNKFKSMIGW